MNISFDEKSKVFHIRNDLISYVIQIGEDGLPVHLYYGEALREYRGSNPVLQRDRGFSPNPNPEDRTLSLDTQPQEYPGNGHGDFRISPVRIRKIDGSTLTGFRYRSHQILQGKPKMGGLPASFATHDDAATLEIALLDSLSNIVATLSYTIFRNHSLICRSVRFHNEGTQTVTLLKAGSMSMDFRSTVFDILSLHGSHCNERMLERRHCTHSLTKLSSTRGMSSHQQAPFAALVSPETTESYGTVYGFDLVYSGNFSIEIQTDQFDCTRIVCGINEQDFRWILEPDASFQTPETVIVYSGNGLNGMSQTYHDFYLKNLSSSPHTLQERPILLNTWEATYFDFNEKDILKFAREGKALGIELLVLDDGWFGMRNGDDAALGDWYTNKEKLPSGIDGLAKKVVDTGLRFGLWIEPEGISIDSELYRAHPEWVLGPPDTDLTYGRSQLLLDLCRNDVCVYLIETFCAILSCKDITYVKWDANRHLTEAESSSLPPLQKQETSHRYILGLYRVMDAIVRRNPHILFEGCSGGGGRFDTGILYYMPQSWTSDNTDALSRQYIQYGTSLVYPPVVMGAHVSSAPNHQTGRRMPLSTRGYCAMSGNFGYELDITQLSSEEKLEITEQIRLYKSIRRTIQFGKFYRIESPYTGEVTAWNFVGDDRVVLFVFFISIKANAPTRVIRLQGLDPDMQYEDTSDGRIFYGDELMYDGIAIATESVDYYSQLRIFQKCTDAREETQEEKNGKKT